LWAERGDRLEATLEDNALAQSEPEPSKYNADAFGLHLRVDRRDSQRQESGTTDDDLGSEPPGVAGSRSAFESSLLRPSSTETSRAPQADQQDRSLHKRETVAPSMSTRMPATTNPSAPATASAKFAETPRRELPVREQRSPRDVSGTKKPVKEEPEMMRRAQVPATLSRPENTHAAPRSNRVLSQPQGIAEKDRMSTQVTISIGHVEVRAEQPAQQPRRAPFRPRVSLTDFLNQRKPERL